MNRLAVYSYLTRYPYGHSGACRLFMVIHIQNPGNSDIPIIPIFPALPTIPIFPIIPNYQRIRFAGIIGNNIGIIGIAGISRILDKGLHGTAAR